MENSEQRAASDKALSEGTSAAPKICTDLIETMILSVSTRVKLKRLYLTFDL